MEHSDLNGKSNEVLLKQFYDTAKKCGLVEDNKYVDGIPNKKTGATEEEVNDFYLLEDWLEYPTPGIIPKKYR